MKIIRILLSNDDGNLAIGSQLLIHLLKDKYELIVAGPVDQRSSIGAAVTTKGFEWEKVQKENVMYYNVKGTPNDAIELVYTQEQPFDLMISGINWGPNLSSYLYRSGTYNAVTCAVGFGLTEKGISLSWDLPAWTWHVDENNQTANDYLITPGQMVANFIDVILNNDLWGAQILNVNFPGNNTTEFQFSKLTLNQQDAYDRSYKPTSNFFDMGDRMVDSSGDNTDVAVLSRETHFKTQ